jgi:hypothetical protein
MLKNIHLLKLTPGLRYADNTGRMLNYIDCRNIEFPVVPFAKSANSNLVWGADFILMDSKKFMGGSGYENVIDMFEKIWDVQGSQIINNAGFAL